jgi:DNA-binding transcriptional ArsR family regulator
VDILKSAARRGRAGVPKEEMMMELSKALRGIAYSDFMRHINRLVSQGLATIEEIGPDDFILYITENGENEIKNV